MSPEASDREFQNLVAQVRGGSQSAARELFERYGSYVVRAVRRKLPADLRKKFDSCDFVQATWASLFRQRSRLMRFEQPRQFAAYVAAIARNKVAMEVRRRLKRTKHNVNRERSLEMMADQQPVGFPSLGPTPSQVAVAREQWQHLLRDQPRHYQQILEMRCNGHSVHEIAAQTQLDDGSVRRILRVLSRMVGR